MSKIVSHLYRIDATTSSGGSSALIVNVEEPWKAER
jgi:hypothetical protein